MPELRMIVILEKSVIAVLSPHLFITLAHTTKIGTIDLGVINTKSLQVAS